MERRSRSLSLGPMFAYEWTARSRRWQMFAGRVLFLLFVLGALMFVRAGATWPVDESPQQLHARTAREFFNALTVTQLALVLLAAPAATAGALCQDRSRGSLMLLLTTDLSAREIVVGKLAARLVPVLTLLLLVLPVVAIGGLLGGVDLIALVGTSLVATGLAILGCTLALSLSNVMSKTHEVLMVVYLLWGLWFLSVPAIDMLAGSVPAEYWAFHPGGASFAANLPGPDRLVVPARFAAVCLVVSAVLLGVAVRDLIPSFHRQVGRRGRPMVEGRVARRFRHDVPWWPSPSLDRNPVLWREWHRDRPTRPIRVVWLTYAVIAVGFSGWMMYQWIFHRTGRNRMVDIEPLFNGIQATFGLLLLSVSAANSLAEERARGSLDVLLVTPLPTSAVVWGKWWGTYRRVLWLAVLPVTITVGVLWIRPTEPEVVPAAYLAPLAVLAHGAMLTSLGLALATWIPRLGPAVAGTVVGFLVLAVGFPLIADQMRPQLGEDWYSLLSHASPFFQVGESTAIVLVPVGYSGSRVGQVVWIDAVWCLLDLGVAAALIGLTLATFNRAMGRVSGEA